MWKMSCGAQLYNPPPAPTITTRTTCSRGVPSVGCVCPHLVVGPWLLWAPYLAGADGWPHHGCLHGPVAIAARVLVFRAGLQCGGCEARSLLLWVLWWVLAPWLCSEILWCHLPGAGGWDATLVVCWGHQMLGHQALLWRLAGLLLESGGKITFLMAAGGCLPITHFFFF